ncbi:MAG: hypothetical protein U1E23_02690 [Reyranellaceae bacterium]
MADRVWVVATLGILALPGCNPLPTPDYVSVTTPPAYRTENGQRVDNAGYKLDNQGYRLDSDGARIGIVDIPPKTAGDRSNAVAGYYISGVGEVAPGRVASTSDITPLPSAAPTTGMNLPTPAQMPPQPAIAPASGNVPPPPGYK